MTVLALEGAPGTPGGVVALARDGLEAFLRGPLAVQSQAASDPRQGRAVIPVNGPLHPVAYGRIRADFDRAMNDPRVAEIVLWLDTPGGVVTGLADLADHVFKARGRKPITALVDDLALSAGYILASAADRILASRTAKVGSVGVIALHVDQSGMLDRAGIKVTEITSRARKGDGSPFRPLDDAALARMQQDVDRTDSVIAGMVARNRGIQPEVLDRLKGATITAQQGASLGLVDAIVDVAAYLAGSPAAVPTPTGGNRAMAPLPQHTLYAGPPNVQVVRDFNSPPAAPLAQPAGNFDLLDAARACLVAAGATQIPNDPVELFAEAMSHTSSDFPALVGETTNLFIRRSYEAAPVSLRVVGRQGTANDFKNINKVQLGEAPTLEKLNEAGEIKHGSVDEAREAYKVDTFARILTLTRQAITNDPTGALGDVAGKFGQAASEREAKQFIALLALNAAAGPQMGDGTPLFDAAHGNVHAAGAGSVLSVTSLDTARKAMRLQKGLDKDTPINVPPRYLLVPAALETTGEQVLANIQPTKTVDVNVFAGKLELVVEPRLDAISPTAWYLVADPAAIDGVEFAYLRNVTGPMIQVRQGFEVDGVQIRAVLDFGVGFLEFRSWYRSPGA